MKSNYKKLGKYIREVNKRDISMKIDLLLGVSIEKIFKPSIANTIGTDMSTYKIIKRNQFAYGPVTSRNGDKISIAMLEEYNEAIVSQAYTPFEVLDTNQLLPEYLMMWFHRPEFDRYARFMSHGSAREIFGWEELCNTELPVPNINKQKEIVKEYNTIVNRIKLNEQFCLKLEEAAQTIYKQWFVDFEFPDENGNTYKSSGGEMEYNPELEKEIPKNWKVQRLDKLTKQICVAFVGSVYEYYCDKKDGVPMLRTTDIKEDGISYKDLRYVSKEFHNKNKKSQLTKGDILVARHGSNGRPVIFDAKFEANALNAIIIKPNFEVMGSKLIHCFLTSKSALEHIQSSLGGSVQEVLNTQKIADLKLAYPSNIEISNQLSNILQNIQSTYEIYRKEIHFLEELLNLLLSKLTTIEN